MNIETFGLYALVSFLYIISPGPAVFLAISNGISEKLSTVIASSFGNVMGLFVLSALSMIGVGSLIMASAKLFLAVKVIGAAYLLFLGFKQFNAARSFSNPALAGPNITPGSAQAMHLYFTEGFLLAVSNPKPILFFIAIFPQFLSSQTSLLPQFLSMTLIFMLISFSVLLSYGVLAKSAKHLFSSPIKMRWFHRVTGGLFIGMGLALLQLKRAQN